MTAENSVARSGREAGPRPEPPGFEIPPDLALRYEVRAVEGAHDGERRLGLFRPGDRHAPSIEIADNRIIARSEDRETIASLVKIAQHNGWDRIDVDGSPEFRKAVWSAASREGLTVSGYEPTFAEQERMEALRERTGAERGDVKAEQPATAPKPVMEGADFAKPAAGARETAAQNPPTPESGQPLSDDDRRLLVTLSRHTEDRKALYGQLGATLDTFQREVQFERIDLNREALSAALERALDSPTLVKAFARSGYEPDALRQMGRGGEWDGEVASAIDLVRSGLSRGETARAPGTATEPQPETQIARAEREDGKPKGSGHDGEDLAELFLHGGAETVAGEPRLAKAVQAQAAMEQHLGEVFDGDASQMASASLEARKMISDVLRRGLDVSVREPTPVQQIEAMHTHPEMER